MAVQHSSSLFPVPQADKDRHGHRGLHGYRHTILGAQVVEHPREERIAHIRIQDYRNRLALLELHHARPIGLHPLERKLEHVGVVGGFCAERFRLIFGHAERESPDAALPGGSGLFGGSG